jgi:hypothetical protein
MSTIARNTRLTRPPLSDRARQLCEDESGLESKEMLPHFKRVSADLADAQRTNLPRSELYNQRPLGPLTGKH